MNHPSELELNMYVDEALDDEAMLAIKNHLAESEQSRQLVENIKIEKALLTRVLAEPVAAMPEIPKFKAPTTLRGFAMINLATGALLWFAQFLWKTVFGEVFVNAATWFTSVYLPDFYELASSTGLYLLEEGTTMIDTYLTFIVIALLTVTLVAAGLTYRKLRSGVSACLLVGMVGLAGMPVESHALQLLTDEGLITVEEGQTIDDTVIAAGDTVLIRGSVTGDVLAFGRKVEVTGEVGGNLFAFAESVNVRGIVGGSTFSGASAVHFNDATVGSNVWTGSEKIVIDTDSIIGGNLTSAGNSNTVEGRVGKDVHAFGEIIEISGTVEEDVEAFANRVRLLGDAHVHGNVRFRSGADERFHRSEQARVDGEVEFLDMPEEFEIRNPYLTIEFYMWHIVGLVAAFVFGLVALWLFPGLRNLTVAAGMEGVKTAGVGLLTLISLPIVAVLIAITVVGIPLTILGFILWIVGIYLAGIVVANFIGRLVMADSDSVALPLLVGLAIVTVIQMIPFLGSVIGSIFTVVGLGLLVQYLMDTLPADSYEHA